VLRDYLRKNDYTTKINCVENFSAFINYTLWFAFWRTTEWFMALPDPTNAQSAFVSVIVGAGAAWFGLYVGGTRQSKPENKEQT
jgi:hypothetical protein